MKVSRLSTLSSAVILALGLSTAAIAEDISSSIRGTLTSVEGSAVTDATITIIHEPSGTKRTLKVNSDGVFSARGLRVGGPYTIIIDSDEYKDRKLTNVYITLGEPLSISEALESARGQVVTVTGRSLEGQNFIRGTSSTFSSSDIASTPAFNRDLKDMVKQNPLAMVLNDANTPLTIAGTNPKYNSLTVDGVRLDDDFGLNGNGYPTERSPISLESVDQLSVVTSPFSTKYGGFTGGQLSVVTKSGGNDFHGSVFYERAKDAWAGTPLDPFDRAKEIPLNFDEETKGGSISGPIIKDKLFFFGSYETFNAPSEIFRGPEGSDAPNIARGVSTQDVIDVTNIAQSVYGYDAGVYDKSLPLKDEKYMVKLDWNINEDHRAAFSYSHASSNSAGNTRGGSTRLYLSSYWYNRANKFDSYALNVYSNWTDAFSTEVKVAYKDSTNGQNSLGGKSFGDVRVDTGVGEIRLGSDQFRHANSLNNQTLQLRFAGEYLYKEHALSFGWEHETVDVFNLFVPGNLGVWNFASIADFQNRQATFFSYQNNPSLDVNDAAAQFKLGTDALYVEDNWELSPELTITYGLRYERLSSNNTPKFNQGFFDRYGFGNDTSVDGLDIILPRFGFQWSVSDELNVYGGFGRYSGGRPNVWLSNTFTNDGSRVVSFRDSNDANLTNVDPSVIPQNVLDAVANSPVGAGNIDALDPGFKIPNNWTTSLGFDYTTDLGPLGEDWRVSSTIIYKKIDEDVKWSDLSREIDTSRGVNGYTVDGRPIYRNIDPNRSSYDLLLSNNSGGNSLIETFTLDKNWDNGFKLNFTYTHQDVNDRTPGTSSTSRSNYRFVSAYDRENLDIANSSYEIKHRLLLNLSYNHEFFEGYNTGMHVIWERRSSRPFSWTLDAPRNDFGLDGDSSLSSDNLLPYIPTGPNDPAVIYASGYSYDQLIAELQNSGIPTTGGPLKRNAFHGPWTTTMDVLFRQEIPGFMEGHKGILTFDIKNALAFFDKQAARVFIMPFGESTRNILDYTINDQGQYVYSSNGNTDGASPAAFRARESTWSVKLGVKYTF